MDYPLFDAQGLLQTARFLPSPNHSPRPLGMVIDLIVIHNISLPPYQFDGDAVIAFFQNQLDHSQHPYFATLIGMHVSSHFFVRRDGELIQFVPLTKKAWHAGQSVFEERADCNNFSIGIELEGADNVEYTDMQYHQLVELCVSLMAQYPHITLERIVGHSDIAPGRKTDPGPAFDWQFFRHLLSEKVS